MALYIHSIPNIFYLTIGYLLAVCILVAIPFLAYSILLEERPSADQEAIRQYGSKRKLQDISVWAVHTPWHLLKQQHKAIYFHSPVF